MAIALPPVRLRRLRKAKVAAGRSSAPWPFEKGALARAGSSLPPSPRSGAEGAAPPAPVRPREAALTPAATGAGGVATPERGAGAEPSSPPHAPPESGTGGAAAAGAGGDRPGVPPPPEPPESARQWVCHCGKAFPSSTRYHKHLRLHTDLRLYKCTHPDCGKSYKRKAHLDRHLRTHQPERPFACTVPGCTKSFPSQQKLSRHTLAHERLRCTICGMIFRKPAKLEVHLQLHEQGSTEDVGALLTEIEPPSDAKLVCNAWRRAKRKSVHSCDDCAERFERFRDLVAHKRQQHPKVSLCEECGKAYRRESALREHQRRVHGEAVHVCPHADCGQVFASASNLYMHERVAHQGLRPFACVLCGQTFAYKHVLKRHRQRLHPSHGPVLSLGDS